MGTARFLWLKMLHSFNWVQHLYLLQGTHQVNNVLLVFSRGPLMERPDARRSSHAETADTTVLCADQSWISMVDSQCSWMCLRCALECMTKLLMAISCSRQQQPSFTVPT